MNNIQRIKKELEDMPLCYNDGITEPYDEGSFIEGESHFKQYCIKFLDEKLPALIQNEREDAIKGYVRWAWNNGLSGLVDDNLVKEYLSQTKGDKK